jgi:hypothetical protein
VEDGNFIQLSERERKREREREKERQRERETEREKGRWVQVYSVTAVHAAAKREYFVST